MTFFANKVNVTNTIITKRTIFIIMFAYIITICSKSFNPYFTYFPLKKNTKSNKVSTTSKTNTESLKKEARYFIIYFA